jgi:hypothetical protein
VAHWHLFDPFVFNPMPLHTGISVDSLKVEFGNSVDNFVPPVLTQEGIQERFSLWEEFMAIDTFWSMISGENFGMDELDYPQSFQNPALNVKTNFMVDLNLANLTVHTAARNSIWGSGVFASEFDNIKEMTAVSALHYSTGLVQFRVSMIRIARRAMRLAREKSSGAAHKYRTDTFQELHDLLLKQLDKLPKSLMPFLSLTEAAHGNLAPSSLKWKSHLSFNHDFLLFLVALTYIHLPNCQSPTLYTLSLSEKRPIFSSSQVLAALLKSLTSIIRVIYQPDPSPQSSGALDTPAPALSTMQSCVAMYMIASAAIAGAGSTGKLQLQLKTEVLQEVSNWVIPALLRISKIKPTAKKYYEKLLALVQGNN